MIQVQGTKPESPGHALGDFGSRSRASAEAVADTIVGPHVGDRADAELVRERFRGVIGIAALDGAALGAAFEMLIHRTRLHGTDGPDYVRIRREVFEWKDTTPSGTVKWSRTDGMGNAAGVLRRS